MHTINPNFIKQILNSLQTINLGLMELKVDWNWNGTLSEVLRTDNYSFNEIQSKCEG